MTFLHLIRLIFLIFFVNLNLALYQPRSYYKQVCDKLSTLLIYDLDLIINSPWRVYYSWNSDLGDSCIDINFTNVTKELVQRHYGEISEYLEVQPYWEAATMVGWLGRGNYQVLLFADQGPAGRFVAVNHVIKDEQIPPVKKSVPLFKLLIKTDNEGKFLVVMDCTIGTAILCAHEHSLLTPEEISAVAHSLDIGEGVPACTKDFND